MVIEDTKQLVEAVRSAARHGLITANDVGGIMVDVVADLHDNGYLTGDLWHLTYEWHKEARNLRTRR